jgi:hypothetical protein
MAVGSRNLALRHQLNVLQQRAPHSRPGRTNGILAAREAKLADDTML